MPKIRQLNKERTNRDHSNDLNRSQVELDLNRETRNLHLSGYSDIAAVKTTLAFHSWFSSRKKASSLKQIHYSPQPWVRS